MDDHESPIERNFNPVPLDHTVACNCFVIKLAQEALQGSGD
jgi:hypothetical protein